MAQLSNVCNASYVINQHASHFDEHKIMHVERQNNQPFVLKAGYSFNDQPNENVPNTKIEYIYNEVKAAWILKYRAAIFLPQHMNSILVDSWGTFKVSDVNIIRDSFVKKKLTTSQTYQLHHEYPGIQCLRTSIFRYQGSINQQGITLESCTY